MNPDTPPRILIADDPAGDRLNSVLAPHPFRPASIGILSFASLETAVSVLRAGGFDCLSRPFQIQELIGSIQRALAGRARELGHSEPADGGLEGSGR